MTTTATTTTHSVLDNEIDTNTNTGSKESINELTTFRTYKRRWYILAVYSTTGFLQGYLWNMWGPIYFSMKRYLDWTPGQLSLLPFYGSVLMVLLSLHSALLLQKIQLRGLMLIVTSLAAFATLTRCIPFQSHTVITIFINLSAIIIGIPGVVTFYLPAFISSRWFPPGERRLATAIGVTLNSFGVAFTYLFGPALVKQTDRVPLDQTIEEYHRYTYIEAGITIGLLIVVLLYFPSSPPSPPSHSVLIERAAFWDGCLSLVKSRTFWLVSSPSYLIFATVGIWLSVLPLDLSSRSITQDQSDRIGFYGALVGSIMGILTGKLGDLTGDLKAILIALSCLTILSTMWLLLVIHQVILFSFTQVFIAGVTCSSCAFSMLPLNFELCVEMCFPVDESSVVSMMGIGISLMNIVFLGILFIPNVGSLWMDYFLVIACAVSLPVLIYIKPIYKRTNNDKDENDNV